MNWTQRREKWEKNSMRNLIFIFSMICLPNENGTKHKIYMYINTNTERPRKQLMQQFLFPNRREIFQKLFISSIFLLFFPSLRPLKFLFYCNCITTHFEKFNNIYNNILVLIIKQLSCSSWNFIFALSYC